MCFSLYVLDTPSTRSNALDALYLSRGARKEIVSPVVVHPALAPIVGMIIIINIIIHHHPSSSIIINHHHPSSKYQYGLSVSGTHHVPLSPACRCEAAPESWYVSKKDQRSTRVVARERNATENQYLHHQSIIINHHHPSSIVIHHHPSSYINHHRSSSIIIHHHPSSSIIIHHPSSSIIIHHHPTHR